MARGPTTFFADPGETVYVQGCRKRYFHSVCQNWAALKVPWA
jgi:hypothetical protein